MLRISSRRGAPTPSGRQPHIRTASSPDERSSRDDRAIQYSVTAVFSLGFAAYLIPAFAGITAVWEAKSRNNLLIASCERQVIRYGEAIPWPRDETGLRRRCRDGGAIAFTPRNDGGVGGEIPNHHRYYEPSAREANSESEAIWRYRNLNDVAPPDR